ncbi:MAG: hypothetical protein ACO27U_04915 [Ilumatobacteraceae bacterium]|jgi:hypothetical protein
MRTTLARTAVLLSLVTVGGLVSACGGDDGSSNGGGGAASVEEFCTQIENLESAVEPDDMAAAVGALQDLIDSAPSKDVREALETLIPVLEGMSSIDENDPEAMNDLMELMMDPKVMEASATLESFGAEECGFEPTS